MFGMTEEELCRVGRAGIEDPSDPAPAAALEERARTGRVKYEATHVRKDGSKFPSEVSSVIVDEGSMSIVILRDISERKQAEEEVRKSLEAVRRNEEQLLILIENLGSAVALIDETGKFVLFNPAFLRIFGLSSESDILNINSQDWGQWKVYGEDGKLLDVDDHPVRKVAITGKPVTGQLVAVWNPGVTKLTWMLINAEPLLREDGTVYRLITTYSDITDRKQMEEDLRKSRDELQDRVQERTAQLSQAYEELQCEMSERERLEDQLRQSQKMEAIGTLAGGIAHDFNNMLAAILGFTEMALEDLPDRPDVQRNLQNVLRASMRARDLVKQILAFSRKTGHERNPLSLLPLIKETVQLLRASIPTTIEIKFTATATSDTVLAAPVEIQQILMNLATNASLAMQEKGGTLEISLTDIDFEPDSPVFGADVSPGEYVQLVVKDTGIGMGPDVMKRVFEPFFTTREVGKGTGMGLAVVYGIVKDLQGTITVESEPGVGSTFSVLLPKVKTDAQAEAVKPVEIPGGNERILFVDDEEMLVEWGRATLERLGYKVTAMTDSREALKTFSIDPSLFDLVITDHAMPQMAGAQLAKELLERKRRHPYHPLYRSQ